MRQEALLKHDKIYSQTHKHSTYELIIPVGRKSMETFWVLENIAHGYAKIHLGRCISCNDGKGPRPGHSGRWHGPYTTYAQALATARGTVMNLSRVNCRLCWPERY